MALGLGLLSVLLWRLPAVGWLLYPFQLLNTFVHELSHGIAATVTGGDFRRFVVRPDLSGTAWSAGGVGWIVVSAGYLGSAVVGGVLTVLSGRGVSARLVLWGLGLGLGLMCLLFVSNFFGVVAGLLTAAALCAAGRLLPKLWADTLLLLLAVQMMLNSLDSLFDLFQLSAAAPGAVTDAQIMSRATGVPAVVWALRWSLVALAILGSSLCFAYRRPPLPSDQETPSQPRRNVVDEAQRL